MCKTWTIIIISPLYLPYTVRHNEEVENIQFYFNWNVERQWFGARGAVFKRILELFKINMFGKEHLRIISLEIMKVNICTLWIPRYRINIVLTFIILSSRILYLYIINVVISMLNYIPLNHTIYKIIQLYNVSYVYCVTIGNMCDRLSALYSSK